MGLSVVLIVVFGNRLKVASLLGRSPENVNVVGSVPDTPHPPPSFCVWSKLYSSQGCQQWQFNPGKYSHRPGSINRMRPRTGFCPRIIGREYCRSELSKINKVGTSLFRRTSLGVVRPLAAGMQSMYTVPTCICYLHDNSAEVVEWFGDYNNTVDNCFLLLS